MEMFLVLVLLTSFAYKSAEGVTLEDIIGDVGINIDEVTGSFKSIRPNADMDDVMNVTIDFNLASIIDFDEANGYLEVSGFLAFAWLADGLKSSTVDVMIQVDNTKIWRPSVLLVNSLKDFDLIGFDSHVQVRYNMSSRECFWTPWIIRRVACTPDVKYYPFDRQICSFNFFIWGDTSSDVQLTPGNNDWGFLYYDEENAEWTVMRTWVETAVVGSSVEYKIELKRRPMYYVVNLIAPILLLGLINACTFLLPVDSGERVGYGITCFLSYVVLLNMIMGFMPTSAAPLSYLSYYTFIMMMFSAGVAVSTIITIRIHFKSERDHIPGFIRGLYKLFTCKYCKTTPGKETKVGGSTTVTTLSSSWDDGFEDNVHHSRSQNVGKINSDDLYSETSAESDDDDDDEITWKTVAAFLDVLFFIGFLAGQAFFSVAYLVPIFVN